MLTKNSTERISIFTNATSNKLPFSRVDVIAGALNANVRYSSVYVPLLDHFRNEVMICMKAPERVARWWCYISVFAEKSLGLYCILCILIIIDLVFLYTGFEKKPLDYFESMFFLFGALMMISMPIRNHAKRSVSRILSSWAIIAGFLAISIYNASFYDMIMVPRYRNQLKTIQDVFAHKTRFVSTEDIKVNVFLNRMHSYIVSIIMAFRRSH